MGKVYAVLGLGVVSAILSGCAPVSYPQNPHYMPTAYHQASWQPNYNTARPYFASYNPSNYNNNRFMPPPMMGRFFPPANNNFNPNFQPNFRGPEPSDVPARRALMANVHQALGTRYTFGGESPQTGFDCSGLMQYVYKTANGITLPRTASEQSRMARTIGFNQMRPGDLIFFHTSGSSINHVGMYVGGTKFIHAATGGARVIVDDFDKPYWQQRFAKFGSILS